MSKLVMALVLAAACGSQAVTPAAPAANESCAPNGFPRPAGMSEGCEVVVGACCYKSQTDACVAAKCPSERCITLDSYPSQIQCQQP